MFFFRFSAFADHMKANYLLPNLPKYNIGESVSLTLKKSQSKSNNFFYSFFILNMELGVVADPESLRCVQNFSDGL